MLRNKARFILLVAIVVSVFGSILSLFATLSPSPPGATRANLRRIQIGMTEEEVRAILGQERRIECHPDQVGSNAYVWVKVSNWSEYGNVGPTISFSSAKITYRKPDGLLRVECDNLVVVRKEWRDPYPPSFWDRFRQWLQF